jgi:predicted MFS family arabinose efflux permease
MALMTMAHSTGMLGGSFLAGLMMDLFHLRIAFSIGAGVMALGVVMFVLMGRAERLPKPVAGSPAKPAR